jgi:hypothetical protein
VEGVVEIVANAVTVAYGTLVDVDGRAAVRVVSLSTPSKRTSSPARHHSGRSRP